jgi:hypothetical protein
MKDFQIGDTVIMEKNKPFIVLQTTIISGVIWIYGFLDDKSDLEQKVINCKWYKLTPKELA